MRQRINLITVSLTLLILFSFHPAALAQDSRDQGKSKEITWGSYLVSGTFSTNYLLENVKGDLSLFRSQFNLKEGLNIGQTSFRAYRDPEKKAFLDRITFDLSGFGAEPYGRASISLEKTNVFSLGGGYSERKYFSDVASFANPLFDAESDNILFRGFHTWDTAEKSYDFNGDLRVFPWLKLNAYWQKTDLTGDSMITLRLMNNEFPLSEPIDQQSNVLRLGSEINIKDWLFYSVSGIYQKFDLNQTTSSQDENLGIRGLPSESSSIYLTSQSRKTQVDMKTWAQDHTLQIHPLSWLSMDGNITSSRSRGHSTGQESMEGQFIWPLYDLVSSAALLNKGSIKKDLDKANFTVHFNISPRFRLNTGYDYYKYTIDNTDNYNYSFTRTYYNRTVTGESDLSQFIGMEQKKYFLDGSYTFSPALTAGAGYASRTYTLRLESDLPDKDAYSYKLNAYYGTLQFKLSKMFSLKATVEQGDYNNVFARLIPLKSSSMKFEGRFILSKDISGSLFYKNQKLENADFSYSSSYNGYGGNLNLKLGDFGAVLQLSKNDLSSSMDIIRFVSLFTETEDVSQYTSDVIHASGGLWFRKGKFDLGAGYSLTEVKGTFPVKIQLPYVRVSVRLLSGFAVTLNYRYFNHNQVLFSSQNYKAHLFNFGFQYDF